jgi:hypothetical protein
VLVYGNSNTWNLQTSDTSYLLKGSVQYHEHFLYSTSICVAKEVEFSSCDMKCQSVSSFDAHP